MTAALKLLDRGPPPSRAILDINLQGEMAWPVAGALAARRIPFVFATGHGAESIPPPYAGVARAENPVELRQLRRMLRSACR